VNKTTTVINISVLFAFNIAIKIASSLIYHMVIRQATEYRSQQVKQFRYEAVKITIRLRFDGLSTVIRRSFRPQSDV